MNLYRYRENGKLYTLEFIIKDIRYMNCGAFEGIYAHPYKFKGEVIKHLRGYSDSDEVYDPANFILDNFEFVSELRS